MNSKFIFDQSVIPEPKVRICKRILDVVLFIEMRANVMSDVDPLLAHIGSTVKMFGAASPIVIPMQNKLVISAWTQLPYLPNITALQKAIFSPISMDKNDEEICIIQKLIDSVSVRTAILAIGVTTRRGYNACIDGTYMKSIRHQIDILHQDDMLSVLNPIPELIVYTGLRLVDAFFKCALDRLRLNIDMQNFDKTHYVEAEQALNLAFLSIAQEMQLSANQLLDLNYACAGPELCIRFSEHSSPIRYIEDVVDTLSAMPCGTIDNNLLCELGLLIRIKSHLIDLPDYDIIRSANSDDGSPSVYNQLQDIKKSQEDAVHNLNTANATGSAIAGIILTSVVMAFEWSFHNEWCLIATLLGISLTVASMFFSISSLTSFSDTLSRFDRKKFQNYLNLPLTDYRLLMTFEDDGSVFLAKLNTNANIFERINPSLRDREIAQTISRIARERHKKTKAMKRFVFTIIFSLFLYSIALCIYTFF